MGHSIETEIENARDRDRNTRGRDGTFRDKDGEY